MSMMMIGTGTPRIELPPMTENESGRLKIGLPDVMTSAIPLAILIIARVDMNGGILIRLVIRIPFAIPHTAPARIPITIETGRFHPSTFKNTPVTTPLRAATEPTERSMPPVKITYDIPTDTIPMIDTCRNTLSTFLTVKKYGDNIDTSAVSRNNPIKGGMISDWLEDNRCLAIRTFIWAFRFIELIRSYLFLLSRIFNRYVYFTPQ